MNLSIIVVDWNTSDLLAQCIESVYAHQLGGAFEVFVVDNASTDGSAQMMRERFPWVRLIENKENVGFARANNQAIRQSSGSYVLLLNPDTEVQPGTLETLVRFMDGHPEAGAAGARLLNPNGTLQISCQPRPTLFREMWMLLHLDEHLHLGSYDMSTWDIATPRKVDVVKGACLIAPREVLFQVGLLDEDYFLYAEELDLCARIQRAGYAVYWVPSAVVTHWGGQSTCQMPEPMFLRLYLSKLKFFQKQQGWIAGLGFRLLLLVAAMPRIVLILLAYLRPQPQRDDWLRKARLYRHLVLSVLSGQFSRAVGQGQFQPAIPSLEEHRQ